MLLPIQSKETLLRITKETNISESDPDKTSTTDQMVSGADVECFAHSRKTSSSQPQSIEESSCDVRTQQTRTIANEDDDCRIAFAMTPNQSRNAWAMTQSIR